MGDSHKLMTLLVIIVICCLGQFGSDIYAPAIPSIASELHAPLNHVQLSMAIYMLGAAVSMLIYGPLSEGIGRRKPMAAGLTLFLVGSILCATASSMSMLITGRFVQGIGVGAAMGLWRAVFRDLMSGAELAKYGSYFSILVTFIVPFAPLVGGGLQHMFGWRAIFVFLIAYVVLTLFLLFYLIPETSKNHHVSKLHPLHIARQFRELLTHGEFVRVCLAVLITYGAFFSWFTMSPVLLIQQLHITPVQYGLLNFIGGGIMYALGGYLNGKLVAKFGANIMMRCGWSIMILAGLILLINQSVAPVVISGTLMYFGTTFIWANAFAKAMTPFGHMAGYAGTTYGCMQIAGAGLIGSVVAHLPQQAEVLGAVFMIAPALAYTVLNTPGWLKRRGYQSVRR